jgi:hypothetical protein
VTRAQHGYRYTVTATCTLDDVHRLGPEALEAAVRAVVLVVPARVVGRQVAVHLEEEHRLADDNHGDPA